jgi:hypothetical protein
VLLNGSRPLSEVFACRDARTIEALLAHGGLSAADLTELGLRQLMARQLYVRHEAFIDAFLENLEQIRPQKIQQILRSI